jgi:hypothetical protein
MTKAVVPKEDKHSPKEGKIMRQRIGSRLQQLYSDVASEPVPDHLRSLLEKLESSDRRSAPNKGTDRTFP